MQRIHTQGSIIKIAWETVNLPPFGFELKTFVAEFISISYIQSLTMHFSFIPQRQSLTDADQATSWLQKWSVISLWKDLLDLVPCNSRGLGLVKKKGPSHFCISNRYQFSLRLMSMPTSLFMGNYSLAFYFFVPSVAIDRNQPDVSGLVHGWILSSNIIYIW